MESRNQHKRPLVLARVYPTSTSLLDTLKALLSNYEGSSPLPTISREGDSHEFAVSLLRETYVFLPDEARSLSPTLSFEHLSTQSEVVNRVIQHLFRAAVLDEPNNVLCYGFRKRRPGTEHFAGRPASQTPLRAVDCVAPCSAVNTVKTPVWGHLLARVGDAVMQHLLTHASIFAPLPNACFLQVAGPPIFSVVKKRRQNLPRTPCSYLPGLEPGVCGRTEAEPEVSHKGQSGSRDSRRAGEVCKLDRLQRGAALGSMPAPTRVSAEDALTQEPAPDCKGDASPQYDCSVCSGSPLSQPLEPCSPQSSPSSSLQTQPPSTSSSPPASPIVLRIPEVLAERCRARAGPEAPARASAIPATATVSKEAAAGASEAPHASCGRKTRNKRKRFWRRPCIGGGDTGSCRQPITSCAGAGPPGEATARPSGGKRRARLPSWQRRKIRKATVADPSPSENAEAEPHVATDVHPEGEGAPPGDALDLHLASGGSYRAGGAAAERALGLQLSEAGSGMQDRDDCPMGSGPHAREADSKVDQRPSKRLRALSVSEPPASRTSAAMPRVVPELRNGGCLPDTLAAANCPAAAQPAVVLSDEDMDVEGMDVGGGQRSLVQPTASPSPQPPATQEGTTADDIGGTAGTPSQEARESRCMWRVLGEAAAAAIAASAAARGTDTAPAPTSVPVGTEAAAASAATASRKGSVECSAGSRPGGGGMGARARVQAQPRPAPKKLRPSKVEISRERVFYNTAFPRRPGLPLHHPLNAAGTSKRAARRVYHRIFLAPLEQMVEAEPSSAAGPSRPNARARREHEAGLCWRVPRHRQHLVALVADMIGRVRKCPYGRLLQHHCPLPPGLLPPRPAAAPSAGIWSSPAEGADWSSPAEGAAVAAGAHMLEEPLGGSCESPLVAAGVSGSSGSRASMTAAPAPGATAAPGASAHPSMAQVQEVLDGSPQDVMETGDGSGRAGELELHLAESDSGEELASQRVDGSSDGSRERIARRSCGIPEPQLSPNSTQGTPRTTLIHSARHVDCRGLQHSKEGRMGTEAGDVRPGTGQGCGLDSSREVPPEGQGRDGDSRWGRGQAKAAADTRAPGRDHARPGGLVGCFTPQAHVVGFVWAVCRAVVPSPLLGGNTRERRRLRRCISELVQLRRRERCNLQHFLRGMGSATFPGLRSPTGVDGPAGLGARGQSAQAHCAASALIGRWMYWILAGLVVPLLRAHFYVTETEPYRQRLFYYRKPVWRDITRRAQRGLFRSTDTDLRPAAPAPSSSPSQWAEGPSAALPGDAAQPAASLGQYAFPPRRVVEALLRAPGRRLGFSVVRLVPRRDGVRPIANLSRSSSLPARPVPQGAGRAGDAGHGGARWARPPGRGGVTRSAPQGGIGAGGRWFVPVNRALSAPYLALRYECRSRRSELLGASVHGVEDAYHRLREYIMRWRQSQKDASQGGVSQGVGAGDEAGPFLATWDVAKCFDSIPIPRLWEVIKPILQHPHYQVVQGSNCTSQPGLTGHASEQGETPKQAPHTTF
ncbi:hypothetical protein CYMTET_15561 [Cymbomonas tetramitiformis]|uniref:Telomerase reverse transcriptase n=1 Tax=Cymbomonas tetramitiformis TaxID=36881 RepID=A0AAE0GEA5_9CHLO|nr:hypothetical protein CYMTET_15561 [Cymbomonas tetramitiformis]